MAKKEPRGLGKGLGAIFGEIPNADQLRQPVGYVNKEIVGVRPKQDTSNVLLIPIDMIVANPFQPRKSFDQEALDELCTSIKNLGLIQPISVRKVADRKYEIISGERRFRACRQAGMSMIPSYVRDANDRGMLEMAIVENIQRENLDPIEEAMSYQRLIEECALTQEEMADRVGKKRATVTNILRLLKLPAKVQHDLKVGLLSVGHAKVLLGLDNSEAQELLSDHVIKEDLSVRELEERIKFFGKTSNSKPQLQKSELSKDYLDLSDRLGKIFQSGISLKRSINGKGSLTLKFDSDEQVSEFVKLLDKAGL